MRREHHRGGRRRRVYFGVAFFLLYLCVGTTIAQPVHFQYTPAPVDNPLKGLVPYAGDKRAIFPHSMEFSYLPLSALMTDWNQFDWRPLETLLNDIASRGHQAVFRIWMVYPGRKEGIPAFLEREGVKVTEWLNTNTQPLPSSNVRTPDYDSPLVRRALTQFIQALGKKYDADPRIGFITAGLLGTWGEWHEHPRDDLFADKRTQNMVLEAYEKACKTTPVLLRYPAGENHWNLARNDHFSFGYHDDSFAWATLDTGRSEDSWFFVPAMQAAGNVALNKWKTAPIGGEIRPELWGKIFDNQLSTPRAQDFAECVKQTHASWLMDTGMFQKTQSSARVANATKQVQRMGYEFFVNNAELEKNIDGKRRLQVWLENRGVAPFYHPWKFEIGAIDEGGQVAKKWQTNHSLQGILPGTAARRWAHELDAGSIPSGTKKLAIRVLNPLAGGLPLHFANRGRRDDGWMVVVNLDDPM